MDLKKRFLTKKKENRKTKEIEKLHRLKKERENLLFLSRHSIISGLQNISIEEYIEEKYRFKNGKKVKTTKFDSIKSYWSKVKQGVTICLYIEGEFRGSSGSVRSDTNVYDDVVNNSINTAFNDDRFPPLTKKDFSKGIRLEIYLTEQKQIPVYYKDPLELLFILDSSRHNGFLVKKDKKEEYFLPDTWKQIPDSHMFISSLCNKAGLPPGSWKGETRLWPGKVTEQKRNLYTGDVIPPEEFSGIDVYKLDVHSIIEKEREII